MQINLINGIIQKYFLGVGIGGRNIKIMFDVSTFASLIEHLHI